MPTRNLSFHVCVYIFFQDFFRFSCKPTPFCNPPSLFNDGHTLRGHLSKLIETCEHARTKVHTFRAASKLGKSARDAAARRKLSISEDTARPPIPDFTEINKHARARARAGIAMPGNRHCCNMHKIQICGGLVRCRRRIAAFTLGSP